MNDSSYSSFFFLPNRIRRPRKLPIRKVTVITERDNQANQLSNYSSR